MILKILNTYTVVYVGYFFIPKLLIRTKDTQVFNST